MKAKFVLGLCSVLCLNALILSSFAADEPKKEEPKKEEPKKEVKKAEVKKAEPKPVDWDGPYITAEVPGKILTCIDQYDKLLEDLAKLKEKNEDKNSAAYKKIKEDFKKVNESCNKAVDSANRDTDAVGKKLDREIDAITKQLDKAQDDAAIAKLTEQSKALEVRREQLDKVREAYKIFTNYCTENTEKRDGELKDSPFGLTTLPKISGKTMGPESKTFGTADMTTDYKIVVFFSVQNDASRKAFEEMISFANSKKDKISLLGVCVDEAGELRDKYFAKGFSVPVIAGGKAECKAFYCNLLPQVTVEGKSGVIVVCVGNADKGRIQAAMKKDAKENKVEKAK